MAEPILKEQGTIDKIKKIKNFLRNIAPYDLTNNKIKPN